MFFESGLPMRGSEPFRGDRLRPVHAWSILLVIVASWWWRVLESPWNSGPLNSDALSMYLPLAKRFLLDPVTFWLDPDRIANAPGSYLYFALFGADPARI